VQCQKFGLPAAQIGSSHLLRTTFLSKTANYLFISTSTTKTVGKPFWNKHFRIWSFSIRKRGAIITFEKGLRRRHLIG
jgi:hypothetical protein